MLRPGFLGDKQEYMSLSKEIAFFTNFCFLLLCFWMKKI